MQLEPGEYFGLVRQIADPNDSNTYYVRAVVRNARTDATIDTVNLTNRGSGRFSAEYQVPSVGVLPFFIVISTVVYTDSGYTTKSSDYSQESETYLIETRSRHMGGGGSGGSRVDYEKIKKMIEEAAKDIEEAIKRVPKTESITVEQISQALMPKLESMGADILGIGADIDTMAEGSEEASKGLHKRILGEIEGVLTRYAEEMGKHTEESAKKSDILADMLIELKSDRDRLHADGMSKKQALMDMFSKIIDRAEDTPRPLQSPYTRIRGIMGTEKK